MCKIQIPNAKCCVTDRETERQRDRHQTHGTDWTNRSSYSLSSVTAAMDALGSLSPQNAIIWRTSGFQETTQVPTAEDESFLEVNRKVLVGNKSTTAQLQLDKIAARE
jgi:hypothetical protein